MKSENRMFQRKRLCNPKQNHYLSTVRAKVLQIHRELEVVNKLITADIIKDCFYGRDKVQHSLLEVYAEHNEKCRALIGKEYTASTVASLIHHLIV